MEPNAPAKKNNLVVILLVVIIILLAAVLAVFLLKDDGSATSADPSQGAQYATQGVTAIDDVDALQEAVNELYEEASRPGISLLFKNSAISEDGKTFSCLIGNSPKNEYDMFIQIFADEGFTDQLFLSGLIRPGEQFESITLDRALEPGDHTVYCAFTQVEEDLTTIHAQTLITLLFRVA